MMRKESKGYYFSKYYYTLTKENAHRMFPRQDDRLL